MTTNLTFKHETSAQHGKMPKKIKTGLADGSLFDIGSDNIRFIMPSVDKLRTTLEYGQNHGHLNAVGFMDQKHRWNEWCPSSFMDHVMNTELLQVYRSNDNDKTAYFIHCIYADIVSTIDYMFKSQWGRLPNESDNIQYFGDSTADRVNIFENDGRTLVGKIIAEYLTASSRLMPSMDYVVTYSGNQVFEQVFVPVIDVEAQEREKQEKARKQAAYKAKNKATRKAAQKVRSRAKR